jgi:hypothetical protein
MKTTRRRKNAFPMMYRENAFVATAFCMFFFAAIVYLILPWAEAIL